MLVTLSVAGECHHTLGLVSEMVIGTVGGTLHATGPPRANYSVQLEDRI